MCASYQFFADCYVRKWSLYVILLGPVHNCHLPVATVKHSILRRLACAMAVASFAVRPAASEASIQLTLQLLREPITYSEYWECIVPEA
jgi:hypothetical protein